LIEVFEDDVRGESGALSVRREPQLFWIRT
jgi:hypothetical protein